MDEEELAKKLIQLYEGDTCIVCGGDPTGAALLKPDDSVAWGGYKNKQRYIRYCWCRKCVDREGRENFADHVEQILKERIKEYGLTQ
jgi:hypothetical protein